MAIAMPVHADTIYKWVDQNGVTNYTTTPPLPASARKVATINASPAMEGRYDPLPGTEEGRYWRQRREREAAEFLRDSRLRQESMDQQEWRARQDLAMRYDQEQLRAAQDRRRQAAFDQCMIDRRIDCSFVDNGGAYGPTGFVYTGRHPTSIFGAAPFPVPGSPLVTNPTPGAPSLSTFNPTPGAFTLNRTPTPRVSRPALMTR
jgi:hypothetical protein